MEKAFVCKLRPHCGPPCLRNIMQKASTQNCKSEPKKGLALAPSSLASFFTPHLLWQMRFRPLARPLKPPLSVSSVNWLNFSGFFCHTAPLFCGAHVSNIYDAGNGSKADITATFARAFRPGMAYIPSALCDDKLTPTKWILYGKVKRRCEWRGPLFLHLRKTATREKWR